MKILEADNLNEIIQSDKKVVVQYGASWCGACKITKPKFERLSNENDGIEFYYVDAENYPESRKLANVENLPTFASFADGKLVKSVAGSKEETIQGVIDAVASH